MPRAGYGDYEEKKGLSEQDITMYARHLCGVTLQECIDTGWFEKDIEAFGAEDQKRIKSELRRLVRSLNSVDKCIFEKKQVPGRPRKMKKEQEP